MKKILFLKFLKDTFKIFIIIIFSIASIVWVIKAVGYLDIVSEDGHGLIVYFWYTILNFPKIITRILPFIFTISLFYKLIEYERKNELLIFWINGITKINFVRAIIVYSFIITFLQLLLNSYVNPISHDKARSYIRSSSSDFFPNLIKEGKFIDAISNLTIFIESKDTDGNFKNVFLSNNFVFSINATDDSKSEIIYAKKGILVNNNDERYLQLIDGKIINNDKEAVQEFDFKKINYDLSKVISNTTRYPKIQEYRSSFVIKCIYYVLFDKLKNTKDKSLGNSHAKLYGIKCENKNFKFMAEEFLKRFYQPLYLVVLALICSLLIFKSKDEIDYEKFKISLFLSTVLVILISEIAIKYATINLIGIIFYTLFPVIIFSLIYIFLKNKIAL